MEVNLRRTIVTLGGLVAFAAASLANAGVILYDKENVHKYLSQYSDTLRITHDFSHYIPEHGHAWGGAWKLTLRDDGHDTDEYVHVNLAGMNIVREVDTYTHVFRFLNYQAIMDINYDGKITMRVRVIDDWDHRNHRKVDDLIVKYSEMWVKVKKKDVPEPGTLSLLGAGLAVIGLLSRRRKLAAA